MASVTHEDARAVTTNATSYASNSFTPAAGDLLIVFAIAGATTAAGTMTDSQGLTFTKVGHALAAASTDRVYCFVAGAFAAASAMTVTFDCTGDTADGCVIFVAAVAGMSRVGLDAVRQSAAGDDGALGTTPTASFAAAALTANTCLGAVCNGANPAALTPPTGWTENAAGDSGYSTPTTGAEYCYRNSGHTSAAVTWGASSASAWGCFIVELDTTVPPASPVGASEYGIQATLLRY